MSIITGDRQNVYISRCILQMSVRYAVGSPLTPAEECLFHAAKSRKITQTVPLCKRGVSSLPVPTKIFKRNQPSRLPRSCVESLRNPSQELLPINEVMQLHRRRRAKMESSD